MPEELQPDICVIGAGSGGLSVAIAAAAFGVSVAIVEKGHIGGERLGAGAVPSAAFVAAATRAHHVGGAWRFGVGHGGPEIDFRRVNDHVRAVVAKTSINDDVARLKALGIKVIRETASFADRRTVTAGGYAIKARRFVLATGTSPVVPAIPGIGDVRSFTTDDIFTLARRPRHLLVLGAGGHGLEIAQAFRRLGSAVTVIEPARALAGVDPEAAGIALEVLRGEGIGILEATSVTQISARGAVGVRLQVETPHGPSTIDGSHLMVAGERVANVADLKLARAGIAHGSEGIRVNRRLRTTNRRVYAVGDVVPGAHSAYRASIHAGFVMRGILFRRSVDIRQQPVPAVVRTDPQIAQVGLDEAAAQRKVRSIRVLRWPYAENERARAEQKSCGFVKLLTDRNGVILGVTIVGAEATEQIALWTLAVSRRLTVADIADTVFAGPSFAEIGKHAAIAYFAPAARRPSVRLLVRLLRLFG